MRDSANVAFEALKALAMESSVPKAYRDTLRRLVRGSFEDLSREEKHAKVEHIIGFSSSAAMVLAAMPVPLLDLPVQAAMVGAVAKVHGVKGGERKLLSHLAGAIGLGFLLRAGIHALPFTGNLSRVARAHGVTWALGQAADVYFERLARAEAPPDPAEARRQFAATLRRASREQATRLKTGDALERVRALKTDWDAGRIDERAFRSGVEAALSGA